MTQTNLFAESVTTETSHWRFIDFVKACGRKAYREKHGHFLESSREDALLSLHRLAEYCERTKAQIKQTKERGEIVSQELVSIHFNQMVDLANQARLAGFEYRLNEKGNPDPLYTQVKLFCIRETCLG